MKIEKLEIEQKKFNINLKFYFFLKYLVKTNLSENQSNDLLKTFYQNKILDFDKIKEKIIAYVEKNIKTNSKKQILLFETLNEVNSKIDLELFIFSLKLFIIKDLLLQEAKMKNLLDITKLGDLNPLSLKYDNITLYSPYSTRVSWALLSLIFFDKLEKQESNFISKEAEKFVIDLSKYAISLKEKWVEPNQIFMLMFNESINQSIISDSGSNYEDRILLVLKSIWIDENKIEKTHDKDDSSTEFDFFFELEWKTYWIWAKRTLRERYKQFIKTAQMSDIDVMIEITLWLDLNEEKAKSILNHWVYIFVSDEVYNWREFLQKMDWIFSVKDLTVLKCMVV